MPAQDKIQSRAALWRAVRKPTRTARRFWLLKTFGAPWARDLIRARTKGADSEGPSGRPTGATAGDTKKGERNAAKEHGNVSGRQDYRQPEV